mmetsp:Transcript_26441/g.61873  ORF Transcript_26441/g.61873 Transcript_26441/m.61873 type:complete len:313 (-) Transcript_26441:321-1259(-)
MDLPGLLVVGLLDFPRRGAGGNAEQIVVLPILHLLLRQRPSRSRAAGLARGGLLAVPLGLELLHLLGVLVEVVVHPLPLLVVPLHAQPRRFDRLTAVDHTSAHLIRTNADARDGKGHGAADAGGQAGEESCDPALLRPGDGLGDERDDAGHRPLPDGFQAGRESRRRVLGPPRAEQRREHLLGALHLGGHLGLVLELLLHPAGQFLVGAQVDVLRRRRRGIAAAAWRCCCGVHSCRRQRHLWCRQRNDVVSECQLDEILQGDGVVFFCPLLFCDVRRRPSRAVPFIITVAFLAGVPFGVLVVRLLLLLLPVV